MRITETMTLNTVLQSESVAAQRMNQLSNEASSGLAVSQPSDDPAAYASIVTRTAQISTVEGRSEAVKVAAGDLNLAESTLDQAGTLMSEASQVAIEASNGTMTASDRANAATQVNSILQQMVGLANTKGSSGYLFGGTKNNTPPFDSSGNFSGNDTVTQVEVADGVLAVSNANGATAFTAEGGTNVFSALQGLATALTSNDLTGIQSSVQTLSSAQTQLISARVDAGESAARLTSAGDAMTSALTQMQISLGDVQDADSATTFSNLTASQNAYQQALQVNKQVLSMALSVSN
ncbi:MAG TPA: flagellar hook-associated protein FlgL [Polyangiaceae bacterium]|nr:flagellar hook-associated protein FlgL [Polyangiaceae bacterium]